MSDDAQKIKSILGEFISKNALSDGIDTARIQENWSSIMGENISAYTKEVSLQKDVLILKLSSSSYSPTTTNKFSSLSSKKRLFFFNLII